MKTIKTEELTGAALDRAVAKCESMCLGDDPFGLRPIIATPVFLQKFKPSSYWAQGGPIIEREKDIAPLWEPSIQSWHACNSKGTGTHKTSPLIAAMRCYVASKLGDEVEIPEELL